MSLDNQGEYSHGLTYHDGIKFMETLCKNAIKENIYKNATKTRILVIGSEFETGKILIAYPGFKNYPHGKWKPHLGDYAMYWESLNRGFYDTPTHAMVCKYIYDKIISANNDYMPKSVLLV